MPSTPILAKKLQAYGITMAEHLTVSDGLEQVAAAIAEMRKKPVDMILCTGGMSVDPDDNTPGAIARSGARIVTYGAPVLPGAMFLLGYYEDGQPVMGLPGCVMYAKATIFDLILPRVAAGLQVTKQEIAALDCYLKWELELGELLGAFDGPILWVSHELGECCRNCVRVCVMENGLTGALQPVQALLDAPASVSAARLTGCKNLLPADKRRLRRRAAPCPQGRRGNTGCAADGAGAWRKRHALPHPAHHPGCRARGLSAAAGGRGSGVTGAARGMRGSRYICCRAGASCFLPGRKAAVFLGCWTKFQDPAMMETP